MNKNEISEIRRRLNPEKNNITCIRGCYVNTRGEIISTFNRQLLSMPQEEAEKYMAIFKRALSGTPGKNLMDVVFEPYQVMDSPEHKALMELRDTRLLDDAKVDDFFAGIIGSVRMEDNYLILMLHDTYDVPFKGRDDVKMDDASEEVFSYILCAICPVKPTKPALSYSAQEQLFRNREQDWIVSAPDVGFMFPAFDDRASNIYTVLYYNRDTSQPHDELVASIFNTDMPMPAIVQKETFQSVLENALEDELSYEVVQTVNEQLCELIEERKNDKDARPLTVSKREMVAMLENCGVAEDRLEAFEERYDEEFGQAVDLTAASIADSRQFQVRTPDVTIKVNPNRSDLIETRMIDGTRYILIRADDGVEVNGVNISITE
jgi:hypothetical protein